MTSGLRDVIRAVPMASIEVHESRLYLFPGKKVRVSGYDEAVDRTLAIERALQTAASRVQPAVPQTSDARVEGSGS